jgi:hypothetical protein
VEIRTALLQIVVYMSSSGCSVCSARERIDAHLIEHSDCIGLTPVMLL